MITFRDINLALRNMKINYCSSVTSIAANIRNFTSHNEGDYVIVFGFAECIPRLIVLIIECLVIVILNIIANVVFVKKKRQLQRRSTYLIIHLAIVNLLVGAVSGATFCNLWTYNWELRLSVLSKLAFANLFFLTSLTNFVAISLERLHATSGIALLREGFIE